MNIRSGGRAKDLIGNENLSDIDMEGVRFPVITMFLMNRSIKMKIVIHQMTILIHQNMTLNHQN